MGLIVKNGQIATNLSKRNDRLKGLISKNGQITQSLRSLPAIVVTTTSFGFLTVIGVSVDDIATVTGVAKASISEVMGV